MTELACLALLPFIFLFFPLVLLSLVQGPAAPKPGFILLLGDGVVAVVTLVMLSRALRRYWHVVRGRQQILALTIFPAFSFVYVVLGSITYLRTGVAFS